MAGVTLSVNLSIDAALSGAGNFAAGKAGAAIRKAFAMAPGSATVDQADLLYAADRNLTGSASENLDLNGVLVSPIGGTISAAEVVLIYVEAVTNGVTVGAAASNTFNGPLNAAGTLTLNQGEWTVLSSRNGWPVTDATGDLLKVAPTGATATYRIVIVARSVAR